jgi:hypothetical protein
MKDFGVKKLDIFLKNEEKKEICGFSPKNATQMRRNGM